MFALPAPSNILILAFKSIIKYHKGKEEKKSHVILLLKRIMLVEVLARELRISE